MSFAEACGLNELEGDWSQVKTVIPYGFGADAHRTLRRLFHDFDIPFIVDRDETKWGMQYQGAEIVSPERLHHLPEHAKVVVTIAKRRFHEIRQVMKQYGLREHVDYCHISQFAQEWYYKYRHEYCIFTLDMAITTACTLNCKHCNMYIPYHKKPFMLTLEDFKRNIDLLMGRIDYVFTLGLLGGEALLNPELPEMLSYLQERYGSRIGQPILTTNAVRMPSEELLKTLKANNVNLVISDYSDAIHERAHADELKAKADTMGLTCNIMRSRVWTDVGFPEHPWNLPEEKVREHMMQCDPGWRGLADGKLYFCNCAWSAEQAGLFKLRKGDCLELAALPAGEVPSKQQVLAYCRGNLSNDYFSFCRVCGGCGEDNQRFVLAAEQVPKKEPTC
ncbi:MAG: radical SAM protein [Selenomonas sp.]|nr:radical SAM protein [Selenomonas sp.]